MADEQHYDKLKEGVKVWNRWRKRHPEILPDLRSADMHGMLLNGINFRHTNLDGADLHDANLCTALLNFASLHNVNLSSVKLRSARLYQTYLKETILWHTDFHKASLLDTMFLNVDLSEAKHLDTVFHLGPSTVGVDTIQRSKGIIADVFLHGTGVSEQLLKSIRSSGIAPFDYYTCFISYSSQDEDFANKLHRDLCSAGVLCWYAPDSLKAGDPFPRDITGAVQSREKVIVVFSKHSLKSDWVEKEVKLAREKEENGKNVLVPIRLDNAVLSSTVAWAKAIHTRKNCKSFENWKQSARYTRMLNDLLNDLRKPLNKVAKSGKD